MVCGSLSERSRSSCDPSAGVAECGRPSLVTGRDRRDSAPAAGSMLARGRYRKHGVKVERIGAEQDRHQHSARGTCSARRASSRASGRRCPQPSAPPSVSTRTRTLRWTDVVPCTPCRLAGGVDEDRLEDHDPQCWRAWRRPTAVKGARRVSGAGRTRAAMIPSPGMMAAAYAAQIPRPIGQEDIMYVHLWVNGETKTVAVEADASSTSCATISS